MKAFKLGLRVASVAGLSTLLSVSAMAGIETSKHDLRGTNSVSTGTVIAGATEICVFCHTPHGASDATSAPLWNRAVSATQTAYTSSTLDGEITLAGSPSLACLSCHDGTQAMNTVINAPSSITDYNYDNGAWIGSTLADIKMRGTASTIANLGEDLRNDHPVAIPYAGGGWSSFNFATGTPTQFQAAAKDPDFRMPKVTTIGTVSAWWIEATGDAVRTKGDLILYKRNGDNSEATDVGFVECATCHDPHNAGKDANDKDIKSFLRMGSNDNSQVCLACHIK